MAETDKMWPTLGLVLIFTMFCHAREKIRPIELSEDNWKDMLKGEWLVKFYAPWCPACRALGPVWDEVSSWSEDLDMSVGMVDVTQNPGLSGRFLVMALPTIFHVREGIFRTYLGGREANSLIAFIDDKKWETVEPIPWWKAPGSPHMSALGYFFKMSMYIRNLHTSMTEEYGLPVWGSYAIFAVATILLGLLLGVLIVVLCDVIYPPHQPLPTPSQYSQAGADSQQYYGDDNRDTEEDVVEDDRKDLGSKGFASGDGESEVATRSDSPSLEGARKRNPQVSTD